MKFMQQAKDTKTRTKVVVAMLGVAIIGSVPLAHAANQFGSRDIKNGSIRSIDVKNGTIKQVDLAPGIKRKLNAKAAPGMTGPMGPQGPAGASGTFVGEEWSLIDRNSIGNFVGALRAGPSSEAFGVSVESFGKGSLGLQTGSPTDKVAFGDQTTFAGVELNTITTVKYSVYTTGENIAKAPGAVNMPGISFELDPTGPSTSGPNYSSLVYVPVSAPANVWSSQDASTADQWFLTGAASTGTCSQTPSEVNPNGYCTLAEVKAFFPDATIQTVAFTKGRDYTFSGAVDQLRINDREYDFEPTGVRTYTVR